MDTTTPPPLVPDVEQLLGFGAPVNPQCDIKDTHTRQEPETAFGSADKVPMVREASALPLLISVETGDALPVAEDAAPWHLSASGCSRRRTYRGRRVTRCIAPDERVEAYTRWKFADERGTPFTRHATFKPPTDHLTPEERIALWDRVRQRVRCFCRECRSANTGGPIECVMMTARESNARDSEGEHLHMLLHIPEEFQSTFDRLAPGWFPNTKITSTDHAETFTASGKRKSGFGYLHKAADPRDRKRDKTVWFRSSGAVLGERIWSTRNLHAKAREHYEAGRRASLRLLLEVRAVERARLGRGQCDGAVDHGLVIERS